MSIQATCSSCGAKILWAETTNRKPIPIDRDAVADGNIELVLDTDPREPPTAYVLDKNGRREIGPGVSHSPSVRYRSHFASCPSAEAHRRSK